MASTLAERIDTLFLSAEELRELTDWPDPVIIEWLNFIRNIAEVVEEIANVSDGTGANDQYLNAVSLDSRQNTAKITTISREIKKVDQMVAALETLINSLRANLNRTNAKLSNLEQLAYTR